MTTSEKIYSYLVNLGISFQEIDSTTWLINDPDKGLDQVFVFFEEPIVILRVNVMKVPQEATAEFYRKLLELNATDLIHGAYGINGDDVILADSQVSATMDIEEFQASLDAIGLALTQHFPLLSQYRSK
jgi:hypothetical protein